MKINVQNLGPESELDLATHRFGPTASDVLFSFLRGLYEINSAPIRGTHTAN